MKKTLLFITMVLVTLMGLLVLSISDNYFIPVALLITNFMLVFYIVNIGNKVKGFINLQSFFLLGFLLFFMGRFVALMLDESIYTDVFCMSFIFYYCEVFPNIAYLMLVLNLILVSYALAFIIKPKTYYKKFVKPVISRKRILVIYIITFISLIFVSRLLIDSIILAITQGYMALYVNQAESYQTPYGLLVSTVSIAGMAVIYSVKNHVRPLLFNTIFTIFILTSLLSILTGSRSAFISSLLLIIWHFYKNKNMSMLKYFILSLLFIAIIYSVDFVASISGARPVDQKNSDFIQIVSSSLFNQGTTLMIFNSSIKIESYPLLGYIKTLLPGIQILFPPFGISERHEFDWSSYMTYHENRAAYNEGFGLGWSIFSDFYILSFKFLPLFCLMIYFFGRLTIYVSSADSIFKKGLLFICIISFFGLSRSSISPLIFTIIVYTIFSLYLRSLKVKKWSVI